MCANYVAATLTQRFGNVVAALNTYVESATFDITISALASAPRLSFSHLAEGQRREKQPLRPAGPKRH